MQFFRNQLLWAILAVVLGLPAAVQAAWALLSSEPLLVVASRRWGNVDVLTFVSTSFPLASSVAGLVLLLAIYRRTRTPRPVEAPPFDPPAVSEPFDRNALYFSNQTIRLADLLGEELTIQGRTFDHCTLVGPCVIIPIGSTILTGSSFEGPLEHVLIRVPDYVGKVGVIPLNDCILRGCRFRKVGVLAPPVVAARFEAATRSPG